MKEKDRLMEELFGKATKFDVADVLSDSNEDLKKIIEINGANLKDLKAQVPEKTLNKIEDEVARDFDLKDFKEKIVNDYAIDPDVDKTILDKDSSAKVFQRIKDSLKKVIIGQDEASERLADAFRRPYLSGFDRTKIQTSIILEGHKGSGKHNMIKEMAKALKSEGLAKMSGYSVIDMSRYQSSSQESLFLQDLYVALLDPKAIIVIEDSEVAYPVFARMISELVIKGSISLSKRYVFKKDQLVDAGNSLDKGVIDHLDGNNKVLVFMTYDKANKLSDIYGKSFLDAINDIITLKELDDQSVKKIADKLINDLILKCQSQLDIKVTLDEDMQRYVVFAYNSDEGIFSMTSLVDKIYDEIVDLTLKNDIKEVTIAYAKQPIAIYDDKREVLELYDDQKKERAEIQKELDDIVGLDKVKEYLLSLEDHIRVAKIRRAKGLKVADVSKHMIFTGNPGTGKTTIARIIGRLFKVTGILAQGQLVEVTRADLVAKYVGQTAPQTMSVIESALGGVLFIDEAYGLYRGKDDSFGLEAIDTLVKAMEDHRDDLVVILAGYSKEMASFLEANSGLRSRFANIIHFDDYTAEELLAIAKSIAKSKDYQIDPSADTSLFAYFDMVQKRHDATSGNGRLARNIVEEAILNQSQRVLKDENASIDILLPQDFDLGDKK